MVSFMVLYNISTYSQYIEVLIGFMFRHTTSNLPPNCSNRAFFIRLLPSLVPSVRRKKARWSEWARLMEPEHLANYQAPQVSLRLESQKPYVYLILCVYVDGTKNCTDLQQACGVLLEDIQEECSKVDNSTRSLWGVVFLFS